MSLYDNYRLANSTAIPQYQGSTGPEAIRVGEYKQGKYDVAEQTIGGIGEASANVINNALDIDKTEAQRLQQETNAKLDEYSKRGDLENLIPHVQRLARNFAQDAQTLYQRRQAPAEFQKQLDEHGKGTYAELTPEQKATYMSMAMTNPNNKLKRDANGRLFGNWTGSSIAGNVDTMKIADEAMKDRVIHQYGSEWYEQNKAGLSYTTDAEGNTYMVKNGRKVAEEPIGKLNEILRPALENHTGYQAMKARDMQFAAYKAKDFGPDAYSDTYSVPKQVVDKHGKITTTIQQVPNSLKQQALSLAKQHGTSFNEEMANIAGNLAGQRLERNVYDYIGAKYPQKDVHTTQEMTANPFALKQTSEGATLNIEGAGPAVGTSVTPENIKDRMETTGKDVSSLQDQLTNLTKDIEKAKRTGVNSADIETQAEQVKAQLGFAKAKMDALNISHQALLDRATRDLNIPDGKGGKVVSFNELKTHAADRISEDLRKIGISHANIFGDKYSNQELVKLIADGKLKVQVIPNAGGGAPTTKMVYTNPSGKQVPITDKGTVDKFEKIYSTVQNGLNNNNVNKVIGNVSKLDKSAMEHSSISVPGIYLSGQDNDAKGLGVSSLNVVKSGGAKLFDMNGEPITDKDYTDGTLVPHHVSFIGSDGVAVVQFKDPKTGKETSVKADMGTTSIAPMVAKYLMKNNSVSKTTADAFAGSEKPLQRIGENSNYAKEPFALKNGTKAHLFKYNDGSGTTLFQMRDAKGELLRHTDGTPYSTSSTGIAASWLHHADGSSAMFDELRKELESYKKVKIGQ